MELTKSGMYHIHVDARSMPLELSKYALVSLGFTETNFSGHPDGFRHFEPNIHLTLKIATSEEFKSAWMLLEQKAAHTGLVGYLEGEYIRTDEIFEEKPYQKVPVPFYIKRRRLAGPPQESFREAELHLVMDKDRSNPTLIRKLLESGLYGAYMPKGDHTAVVLTIQGFREDISAIAASLRGFLRQSGGAYRCTLKEELAIRHRLFGVDPIELPEIIAAIMWR